MVWIVDQYNVFFKVMKCDVIFCDVIFCDVLCCVVL